MYNYNWDSETGGFILNSATLKHSLEPRPVYYQELDLLGFNKFWNYPKNDIPLMWAEATSYIYRGRKIARTIGGGIYTAPVLEIYEFYPEGTIADKSFLGVNVANLSKERQKNYAGYDFSESDFDKSKGNELLVIDIPKFIESNRTIMDGLVNNTIKELYNTYKKYKNKVDIFQVAFSGGKDSIVLLDLVKKAIPKKDFIVVFSDTQMEFPDTYELINQTEFQLKKEEITFLRAKSNLEVMDSWDKFGPPANTLRWCCSVHKSAPQLLKLRDYFENGDAVTMSFVGVRSDESLARSEYDEVAEGKKTRKQLAFRPILHWNSAEVWLYQFQQQLVLNKAYQKGSSRVGCLVCPMAKGHSEYIRRALYGKEVEGFFEKIAKSYGLTESEKDSFVEKGFWRHRASGKVIKNQVRLFSNYTDDKNVTLHLAKPKTDWRVWIKTLGELSESNGNYVLTNKNFELEFQVNVVNDGMQVIYPADFKLKFPTINKYFKQVFIKAVSCIMCKTCEANCPNGRIKMNGKSISIDNCNHCYLCHSVADGCLVYQSLKLPEGDGRMSKSISCYATHVPKRPWVNKYISMGSGYFSNNPDDLSPKKQDCFKIFLRHADLLTKQGDPTNFASSLNRIGADDEKSSGLMLVNMAYSPQINWYIRNIQGYVSQDELEEKLIACGQSSGNIKNARSEFPHLINIFADVGLGLIDRKINKEGKEGNVIGFSRLSWEKPEPLVILYALYKMAEANGMYQYSLERLLDFTIEDEGMSPAQIFGINAERMAELLRGLRSSNSDFVSYSENHGMRTLDLKRDKTSSDVLELF